jgi:hypothetical protein
MSCKRLKDAGEVLSLVPGESARDIFPDNDRGFADVSKFDASEEKTASLSSKSTTLSSDGQVLAWAPEGQDVGSVSNKCFCRAVVIDVRSSLYVRVMAFKH